MLLMSQSGHPSTLAGVLSTTSASAAGRAVVGKAPLGRPFKPVQKAANQPAFIRIGIQDPPTARSAAQPAVATASGHTALTQSATTASAALPKTAPSVVPAAATAVTTAVSSGAASAARLNRLPAALPATSGPAFAAVLSGTLAAGQPPDAELARLTTNLPRTVTQGRGAEQAESRVGSADVRGSSAFASGLHDIVGPLHQTTHQQATTAAAHAVTPPLQNQKVATNSATAAGTDLPLHTPGNAARQQARPSTLTGSSQAGASGSPQLQAADLEAAAPSETLMPEDCLTASTVAAQRADVALEPAVTEGAGSQPRLLLSSKRKKKGPKAARVEEPAKSNSSWQELLELSSVAEMAAATQSTPGS